MEQKKFTVEFWNRKLTITVSKWRLRIEHYSRPRYTLAALLAECDASAPRSEEDKIWLNINPVGREHDADAFGLWKDRELNGVEYQRTHREEWVK
jgi:hypothetical protein